MIQHLPTWIEILFIGVTILCLLLFHYSNDKPKRITSIIVLWSILHSILAYSGFYLNSTAFPPRFILVLAPAIAIILFSISKNRNWFVARRNRQLSTLLHIVRFPVEIILMQLFIFKMVPQLMTFEGRNFDIIMGISAPLIALLIYKKLIGKRALLIWNVLGLIMILFIFLNGIFSAELPFQQLAFDQPNIAPTYFPFILLPSTIVPIVIWTHISDIIILRKELKVK